MWPEVAKAESEKRCELVLSGSKFNERIVKDGLDIKIFDLVALNYLNISDTNLTAIPDQISNLTALLQLVLENNKLTEVNLNIFKLSKLTFLDLSKNCLKTLPSEIENLTQLGTLKLSTNGLQKIPSLKKCTKLTALNAANNELVEFPDVCYDGLTVLADIFVNNNQIESIPVEISNLKALKNLDVGSNKIKELPGELVDCSKLKDLNVKNNPISDRRLLKLVDQCRTKQILDYVKQNCPKTAKNNSGDVKGNKKGSTNKGDQKNSDEGSEKKYTINVEHVTDQSTKIIILDDVKTVRGHIVGCIIKNLEFTEQSFKQFIQLQTKLHETICQKRNLATIATHDLNKLGEGNITYTAKPPKELQIQPLNRPSTMTGAHLFSRLQNEAENLRKEKKRNVYSGIHKYLYLLEGQKLYPCLLNSAGNVISFPPITNSEITKISVDTKSIFVEVTSGTSLQSCKHILNTLLKDMVLLFEKDLLVQQVKNLDIEGNMKMVYPSRSDLIFEDDIPIKIARE